MLVQINDLDGTTWILDPLAVDIGPLGTLLSTRSALVHSGAQDLAILWRETQHTPAAVFDVQVAAGLTGMRHPMRLNDIVATVLDEPMDKSETLSDWSKRPLTNKQLSYAARDVEYLGDLAEVLKGQLQELGRSSWIEEECHLLNESAKQPSRTVHSWVNWDIAPRLDAHTQRILGCLFEWRNQKGRDKNQPANFMLSDGLALDIARRQPHSLGDLAANRRIPQGLIRRLGAEIVAVVRHVNEHKIDLPLVPTEVEYRRAKAITLWAETWGLSNKIAPGLLLSTGLAHQVARHGTQALTGWRAETIAEPLQQFLDGKTLLGMGENGSHLVPTSA